MKQKYNQAILLSAQLSTLTDEENLRRSHNLASCLDDVGISYTKTLGCYKGVDELSILAVVKNNDEIETTKGFAFNNFDQESILYQDSNGYCYLEYQNCKSKKKGRLTQVSEDSVNDDYTIVNGKVFIVK